MPMYEGYRPKVIQANIAKLIKEGYPPDRAVAASYQRARDWFEIKHPGKPIPFYLRKKS